MWIENGYKAKNGKCSKHGKVKFIEQYSGFVCSECMAEDFHAMENEQIEIIAALNLNEIGA